MKRALFVILSVFLFSSLTPQVATAQTPDLSRAYKKEFAYLEAQREALEKRLAEVSAGSERDIAQARRDVDALQGRALNLSLRADELENSLAAAEREVASVEEASDALEGTFELAGLTLSKYDIKIDEVDAGKASARIEDVFQKATGLLGSAGEVRIEEGQFFAANGLATKGKVVHIGRIASYGLSDDVAGALAPAGDGALKIWSADASESARRLGAGEAPKTLSIFLYENLDKPIEERVGKTPLEIVQAGGVIAWVIVFIGLLALALVLFRLVRLFSVRGGSSLTTNVVEAIGRGERERALELARGSRTAIGRIILDTLLHFDMKRAELEDVVSEALLRETPAIERFGNAIMVFAAVSPLLGLLGTVTGMISTFDVITEYGTGDPKMLSGGISEALITTQLGLIVAIPALLVGNLLNSKASEILDDMEHAALRVINAGGRASDSPITGRRPQVVEPEISAAE